MNLNINNKQEETIMDLILEKIPMILAFLVPVFFLPTTLEFFEFNKLVLLTLATVVMTIAWIAKIMQNKKIGGTKSIMDLPLFLVIATIVLSTIFSVNLQSG